MNPFKELCANVLAWAVARNLIAGSDPKTQFLKTVSEFGEVLGAIDRKDVHEVRDGIGDVLVTLVIVFAQLGRDLYREVISPNETAPVIPWSSERAGAVIGCMADNVIKGQGGVLSDNAVTLVRLLGDLSYSYGYSLADCLQQAYDSIKDRRGVMFNGAFIKSDDPRYVSACEELGLIGANAGA